MKKSQTTSLAKGLRRKETQAEQILWSLLRSKQLNGVKFRRQQPVGDYIVDFVSFDKKLVVETDGGQHNAEPMMQQDEARTKWLKAQGFRVMRFWNSDVISNTDGVITSIKEALDNVSPSP